MTDDSDVWCLGVCLSQIMFCDEKKLKFISGKSILTNPDRLRFAEAIRRVFTIINSHA